MLSHRYATKKMNEIFSEHGKIIMERNLWLAVLEAQKDLGMEIPEEAIKSYKEAKDNIDLTHIKEIELRTKHDVKAKIEAYNMVAGGIQYIHRGMTSRDLTDNVEQMQIRQASTLIFGKYVSVLRHLLDKANEYRHVELTGRTHHQAAQTTLLGRRFSMWAESLLIHLQEFETFIRDYPLRGIKGPVGTQFDILSVLNSSKKVNELETRVAKFLGFARVLDSPGQVYPRSFDFSLTSHLAVLASVCENFAKTIRLMAGYELVTEGFKEGQVGSSIMPHKMNTRSTERICALAELVKMYADGASRIAGDQWEEGDVSCSAIRRIIIPDAFYASDGVVETTLDVLNNMGAYISIINREVDRYLPFLATTEFLTIAMKHGLGREEAYSIIRKYSLAEALRWRETGSNENNLTHLLAEDPTFKEAGITLEELEAILRERSHFVGNAYRQIDAVKEKANKLLERYSEEAKYEPYDIL